VSVYDDPRWYEIMGRYSGRNDWPERLYDAWAYGRIDVDLLRAWILEVWESAEWPETSLGQRAWLRMFKVAGFVTNGPEQPTAPLTIYRGCVLWRSRAMSWTTELPRARWFAERTVLFGHPAGIFTATVRPSAVLARLHDPVQGRGEFEVLVNPNRLRGRNAAQLSEAVHTPLALD
jgi:hypothetical protein